MTNKQIGSSSSLAPALLLSMPQLTNPHFSRTVVLLCRHNEDGAFGLVVNRPLMTSGPVTVQVRSETDAIDSQTTETTERELQVWIGGPVEPQRSWILVGHDEDADEKQRSVTITEGLYLSTSPDLLRRLLGPAPPARTRLIVGYSGWAGGQLEAELRASAWLTSDVDRELIFSTPPDRMWESAIRRLGADPATLHMSSRGVH
jgi:putative transcriptional regulator